MRSDCHLRMLLGVECRTTMANQIRNLDEQRIATIQAVFERA